MPVTEEAKIVAFADAASHLTRWTYFDMACETKDFLKVYQKMERDFCDLSFFPKEKEKLAGLHQGWLGLIKEYEKICNKKTP